MLSSRLSANSALLSAWQPDLLRQIHAAPSAPSLPGSPETEEAQARGFLANPFRFNLKLGDGQGLYGVSLGFHRALAAAAPAPLPEKFGPANAGALIALGAGWGTGLWAVLEAIRPPLLVLGLGSVAELQASLAQVDWSRLKALLDGGMRLLLRSAVHPDELGRQMRLGLRHYGWAGDGAWLYCPTPTSFYRNVGQGIIQRYGEALSDDGFFEDECTMLANAALGLGRRAVPWLTRPASPCKPVPALIVGSGPSLDADLEAVRRLAESCVVISCGTGLGALLRNAIRPDLHIELENDPMLARALDGIGQPEWVRQIPALLPSSVHPSVLTRFARVIGYLRDAIAPHHLLVQPGEAALPGAYPLVGNAGLGAALWLGFTEIYLAGIDCGTRQSHAHSRYSVYDGSAFTESDLAGFSERLPGNFGGEVQADRIYRLSVDHFASAAARISGRRLVNLSDGALLPGFIAQRSATVLRPPDPAGRDLALTQMFSQDVAAAPARIKDADLQALADQLRGLESGLRALIAQAGTVALAGPVGLFLAYGDMLAAWEKASGPQRAVFALVGGTLRKFLASLTWFINRVPDSELQAFWIASRGLLVEAITDLIHEARTLVQEIRRGEQPALK